MHAVVVTGYGGDVDRLELRDVPEPGAGPGEVKVRVTASSVNPVDWKLRSGRVPANKASGVSDHPRSRCLGRLAVGAGLNGRMTRDGWVWQHIERACAHVTTSGSLTNAIRRR